MSKCLKKAQTYLKQCTLMMVQIVRKILGLIPPMTLEGTEFKSSFKNVQCNLCSYYLCISFQFCLVNLCQLSSHRLYPKQVKLKLSAEQHTRRKYWRLIYFKITCLTLLSGYIFLVCFKMLLRFLLLNTRYFLNCCECKYAPIDWDWHMALLHLQLFKINQKCLRAYILCYPPHLNAFCFIFVCLLS